MEEVSQANDKSHSLEREWQEKLKSDFWKLPPKWTRTSVEKVGIWKRIKKLPRKAYEFLVVRISYEDYFTSQLRSRYMDVEGNFRTTLHEKDRDPNATEFIKELLILSKEILEKEKLSKTDLLTASSLLDEAEERMVWVLPYDIKMAKIHELHFQLDRFEKRLKDNYEDLLEKCKSELENCNIGQAEPKNEQEQHKKESNCNAFLEEVVRSINKNILDKRINTGLQIERLRSLRFWGLILLILFILLFPMAGNTEKWEPYKDLIGFMTNATHPVLGNYKDLIPLEIFGGWAVALGFCVIGGIGGFLSGLLQVRTSNTNLELYEEGVLLFQIRPIFGAFAAMIVFVLMSWSAFDSVVNEKPGAIVLAAFLSGFTEKYFLQLLQMEPESKKARKEKEPEEKGS